MSGTARDALCKQCHVARPERGRSRCEPCAERRRQSETAQRDERRQRRLCVTCGERAVKARRYCARHLAYYAERDRAKKAAEA